MFRAVILGLSIFGPLFKRLRKEVRLSLTIKVPKKKILLAGESGESGESGAVTYVYVTVTNTGNRPITVTELTAYVNRKVRMELTNKQSTSVALDQGSLSVLFNSISLPALLKPGAVWDAELDLGFLKKIMNDKNCTNVCISVLHAISSRTTKIRLKLKRNTKSETPMDLVELPKSE